jgi:dipeptidyl aminopeptidase/acylaminoacyl peptidase
MKRVTLCGTALLLVSAASVISWPTRESSLPAAAATHRAIGALHPRISPAGDAIAFSYDGAIWRLPRQGGVMKRLTDGEGFDIEPAWSPDGKRIAFINSRTFFGGELRLIDAADGSAIKLPISVTAQGKLHFHPDGDRVLGNFQSPGKPESLTWFNLQSGELKSVLTPARAARRLALSTDGKQIAFVTTLDVPGEQTGNDGPQNDLWRVAADGGEPEKIVRFAARVHDLCWAGDPGSPGLIVTTDVGGAHYDLWSLPLVNPERAARRITFGAADEDRPSVSRDGRRLVYTDNREGSTSLVVRDLTDDDEQTLAVTGLDFGKPAGTLHLKVVEKGTGRPLVARVTLEEKPGKFHAPVGSLYRVERGNGHFYCREQAEWSLPGGTYQLRAYRGPEYRACRREIRIEPDKTTTETIELDRWETFGSLDLYSGENHIHANYGYGEWYNSPQSMLDQCEGEDLNVCNFMVANSDTDGIFDREFFRGRPDAISRPNTVLFWNQEFRSTIWGHMTLVNLRQLVEPIMTGFQDTTNPWDVPTNSDIADRTHLQRGLVNYTHVAQNPADPYLGAYTGKGLPIDVALGKIDTVDINNSFAGSVPLWYRLLNCGFRLPASAGTDCFLNRVRSRLPGSDRAYVRIDGDFSYSAWINGLREGRSFVTNGPRVELFVDDRLPEGATLELPAPRDVRVLGRAVSQFPLDKVEIVYNGKVVAATNLKENPDAQGYVISNIRLDRSGWLAVRASGPAHPDHPGPDLYAHTSPVYVQVSGKPTASKADAEFFLAWIDRLAAAVGQRDRIPSAQLKAHVESQIDAARTIYRKIAEQDN